MHFIIFTLLLTTAYAIPIDNIIDVEPNIEAVNTYLFGEPNPEWLKYVDDDGLFDPSLVDPKHPIAAPEEPELFYNAVKKVKFWLYTQKEPVRQKVLLEDLESIKSSTFDPSHPVRFLIHGWNNDERSDMIQTVKNAYMAKADFNIIVVDWGNGAGSLTYVRSRNRINKVADVLKRFIVFIVNNMGVKLDQIQLVGHSLGAHIAGLTGKTLEIGRIPVIVGLDPASPLFSVGAPYNRLDATDAEYVEVIHTAGGSLGFIDPLGTADFYPNYGRSQPGCGLDLTGSCAHSRSYEFFAESILTDSGFWSNQCGDYHTEIKKKKCNPTGETVTLGGDPLHIERANGNYYLMTNKKKPFAQGGI